MALLSLREMCEQEESEYLQLQRTDAYVNGTQDQYRDDAECVRENLYGGFAPKDSDAFSMHDPYMDGYYCYNGSYYQKPPKNWVGWFSNGHDVDGNPFPSENIYDGGNNTRLRVFSIPHGGRKFVTEVLGRVVATTYEHWVEPD